LGKTEEYQAKFAACSNTETKFRLGLIWVDQLLAESKYLEAVEAAGIIKPFASISLEQAWYCQRAGRAFLRLYDYDKAGYYLNEALNQLGDHPDPLDLCRVYHDLAWMQYRQGYLEKARVHAVNAELALGSGHAKDKERKEAEAECHHLYSLIESAAGNYEEAVSRLQREISLRQGGGDEQRLAAAYNKLSSVLQTKGDILKSLDYLRQSLELAERSGNIFRKSISLKNMGELHFILGDLEQAWKCHTDSLSMSVQAGNYLGFVFNHAGLGRIYRERGAAVSAMTEYAQALDAARRIRFRDRESGILADMADLLCDQGLWTEAQERLDQARVLDNARDQDPSPWHLLVSARVEAEKGRPAGACEAVRILESLLAGPVIIDDEEYITIPELRMAALMLKGRVEEGQGRREHAAKFFAAARETAEEFCRDFSPEQKASFRKRRGIAEIFRQVEKR
jgi:tetratricopeptide (TPR) repeat protein